MDIIKQNIMLEYLPIRAHTQAAAEGEISPPGMMPPIENILSIDGRTTATAEALEDAVIVDGVVNLGILYVCSAGLVHGFDSVANFKHTIDMPGSKAGTSTDVIPTVGQIDYKVTPDGLSVHANVDIDCVQYQRYDVPVVASIAQMPLETKTVEFESESFESDVSELKVTEEARMPRPIEKILGVGGHIRTQSVSREANRAVIEGVLRLSVIYLAPDGTLVQTPIVIPFTQYSDLPEGTKSINASSKFSSLNASQVDEDIIAIEAMIETIVVSRVAQSYQALSDAYSMGNESIECYQDCLQLSRSEHADCRCSVRINAETPVGYPDVDRVLVARFRPQIDESIAQDASVAVNGVLHGSFIYLDRDGNIHGFDSVLPFECIGEAPGFSPDMEVFSSAACELIHAGAAGSEIPLQVALEISADGHYFEEITVVNSVDQTENIRDVFGPVVYFPDAYESLWDVGKKFAISLDDIRSLNPDIHDQTPHCVLLNLRREA